MNGLGRREQRGVGLLGPEDGRGEEGGEEAGGSHAL